MISGGLNGVYAIHKDKWHKNNVIGVCDNCFCSLAKALSIMLKIAKMNIFICARFNLQLHTSGGP